MDTSIFSLYSHTHLRPHVTPFLVPFGSKMLRIEFFASILLCIILPFLFLILAKLKTRLNNISSSSNSTKLPKVYPIFGSIFTILKNKSRRVQWTSEMVLSTPNLTFTLHRPFGYRQMFTANAANVQHMLKNNFPNYRKGDVFRKTLKDFLGDGIFNADGDNWRFQRQVSSHEFNTRSLRNFVETVVDSELSDRLIPVLKNAAANKIVLDFQDILQRFAFDNICKIAFGYDPAYLLPSLPQARFAVAFESALTLISERFNSNIPIIWKIKRALNIGSEKRLKIVANEVREFAKSIMKEKKQELHESTSKESVDLLSRFLSSGHSDEDFVTDIVISFILAGRDTTSAALTWFFWLLYNNAEVENEIVEEIKQTSETTVYEEVKDLVYTHASLCESMRLYPPVPVDTKSAVNRDVLPDGTVVEKGTRISYHPYAMGRVEKVWGPDWEEFRPQRWLEEAVEESARKWSFVGKDNFTYPVFQAGPRICLGKDMAFLQMKRVVAGVLRRFRVVPVAEKGSEPIHISDFTSKMKGGFPVRIEERDVDLLQN
ncbi:cytochrome P450 94A2-like [Olea europaea subsp. europaea]|uniref:Cytochrome P450 94A2-like n=1 Tax=Olea europaea subsp. europaea TaxID=158383 RepID=A0A8S0RGA9_OLEEU|nr:cytochrome P450 94A2-like [Olea europaea subsp. europaea]